MYTDNGRLSVVFCWLKARLPVQALWWRRPSSKFMLYSSGVAISLAAKQAGLHAYER